MSKQSTQQAINRYYRISFGKNKSLSAMTDVMSAIAVNTKEKPKLIIRYGPRNAAAPVAIDVKPSHPPHSAITFSFVR